MLSIKGIYEVAISVKDINKAESFYREVLGLETGVRNENRNMVFLRAGGNAGMLVLQENKNEFPLQHFAFTIDEADVENAAKTLNEKGIKIDGPRFHEWMPA